MSAALLARKRPLVVLKVGLGLALLFSPAIAYGIWRGTYYWEMDDVRRGLESIPGVTVEKVWGHEDLTLTKIGALIHVEGKGPLEFKFLDRDALNNTGFLYLSRIGPWYLNVCGQGLEKVRSMSDGSEHTEPTNFWAGSMNIGPQTFYTGIFPSGFTNVRSVVERYDELLAAVEALPRLPDRAAILNPDGLQSRYARTDKEWDYRSCPEMLPNRP